MMLMKALSVWQPYAWALCVGLKTVENRDWRLWDERIGRWTLIHSGGEKPDPDALDAVEELAAEAGLVMPDLARKPSRGIVGAVRFSDDVPREEVTRGQAWATGPHCWVADDAMLLREVIPCRGYPSFFVVNAKIGEREPLISNATAEDLRAQITEHARRTRGAA